MVLRDFLQPYLSQHHRFTASLLPKRRNSHDELQFKTKGGSQGSDRREEK